MADTLSWAQTYSLAASQGLSPTQAAQSANNWAAQGGKPSAGVNMAATTTAAPTSWTTSQAQQITGQSNPVSTANAPLTISNSGSSGNSSSLIPSANNNTSSLIPSAGVSAGTSGNATSALANYATDTAARDAEIARAQAVYQAQSALGNWGAASSAHDWANQVRDAGGLGGTYNTLDGSPLIADTRNSIIPQIPEKKPNLIPQIPQYTPYQPQEFQYTPPNYSISADPSKTSFIPTARAKDRWLQQEQMNAENAYKQYTSQFGAYQQGYNEQQDALSNAMAKLPYEKLTVAQQAELAMAESKSKATATETAYKSASERWQTLGYVANEADAAILGVPVGTKTNDASYRDATLAKSAGGGGGGSGSSSSSSSGSGGNLSSTQVLNAAISLASKDPRLADPGAIPPKIADGVNYFTLSQLVDAHRSQILNQYSNNDSGRYNAISDEDIWNNL